MCDSIYGTHCKSTAVTGFKPCAENEGALLPFINGSKYLPIMNVLLL